VAVAEKPGKGGRSFGLAFGGLFAVVALYRLGRGRPAVLEFAIASALFFVAAWRLWMRFARALGWVNSRILLTIFFFGIITPYGALQRALGRDRLGRRWRAAPPAWTPPPSRLRDANHYDHLY
jgi:hypothetical protein